MEALQVSSGCYSWHNTLNMRSVNLPALPLPLPFPAHLIIMTVQSCNTLIGTNGPHLDQSIVATGDQLHTPCGKDHLQHRGLMALKGLRVREGGGGGGEGGGGRERDGREGGGGGRDGERYMMNE